MRQQRDLGELHGTCVNGRLALERRFGYSRSSRFSCGIVWLQAGSKANSIYMYAGETNIKRISTLTLEK